MTGIQKAIDLFNLRNRDKDHMYPKRLGMLLVKNGSDTNKGMIGNAIARGKYKSIKIEYIERICQILKVDANFLFGFPSVYDKEYEKLKR